MKKKLMIILAMVSIVGIAVPALAGDWVAALEKEILETQNIEQAISNAEKSGADREEVLLAAVSILETNPSLQQCSQCDICKCKESSTYTGTCTSICEDCNKNGCQQ